jgi:hypothetical protein
MDEEDDTPILDHPCVKSIVCGLGTAGINALKAAIQVPLNVLTLLRSQLNAYLIYLDILTAPVKITGELATSTLQTIKSTANIIPINLVSGCFQLGLLNEIFNVSLNQTIADIEKLVNTLNRYLSLRDEVEAQLADVEKAIKVLTELNVIIEACQPPPQPPA